MKTVIKGVKRVRQLNGIGYDHRGRPNLIESYYIVPNPTVIQFLDYELITRSMPGDHVIYLNTSPKITIFEDGKLCQYDIFKESISDEVKTIFINKYMIEEDQDYLRDEIMAQYNLEFDAYYSEFLKKYEDDKPTMIQVKNWLDNGMTREEVLDKLEANDKQEKNDSLEMNLIESIHQLFSKGTFHP